MVAVYFGLNIDGDDLGSCGWLELPGAQQGFQKALSKLIPGVGSREYQECWDFNRVSPPHKMPHLLITSLPNFLSLEPPFILFHLDKHLGL